MPTTIVSPPARRPRTSWATRAGWALLVATATPIAIYASVILLVAGAGPPFVAVLRSTSPVALTAHLAGGLIALALAPWQVNTRLRTRAPNVHRWIGRTYLAAVLAGGSGGFALARTSQEGLVTHMGFGSLAVLWVASAVLGYRAIRAGRTGAHRAWMLRSVALTFAAVTLRIILPIELAAGIPFHDAYQMVSWTSWVPNLIVVEWFVLRRDVAVA